MFKKQQRWIALLVTFTFAWLLQVSTMPLVAVDTTEKAASASVEQAPGLIEQTGDDWGRTKPKTAPILFILGVVALALLYVLIHGIDIDAAPAPSDQNSKDRHFGQGFLSEQSAGLAKVFASGP